MAVLAVMILGSLRKALAVLLVASFATSQLAQATAGTVSAGLDEASIVDMADLMPCCPHKSPPADECPKCLLLAVCAPQSISLPVTLEIGVVQFFRVATLGHSSDPMGDSLGYDPPSRPPRSQMMAA